MSPARRLRRLRAVIGTGQFGDGPPGGRGQERGIDVALKHIRPTAPDGGNKIKAEERGAELQRCFEPLPDLVPGDLRARPGGERRLLHRDGARRRAVAHRGDPCVNARFARGGGRSRSPSAISSSSCTGLSDGTNREPILHSDLKPEHVLVLPDGSIRVLDLGIAKSLQANKSLTGNAWASAPYASPERLEDGQVRAGDDHWALGVMLFEMASGYHPYQPVHDRRQQRHARARDQAHRAAGAASNVLRAGLAASIRKMLSPQPPHRYQTAGEIVADLRSYLDGRETTAAAENAKASQRTQVIPAPTSHRSGRATRHGADRPDAPRLRRRAAAARARQRPIRPRVFRVPADDGRPVCWLASPWPLSSSCSPSPRGGMDPDGALPPGDSAHCSRPTSRPSASSSTTSGATRCSASPRRFASRLQEHMVSLADRAILDFRQRPP